MNMKNRLLVFTDLDGTLLDFHTYSFAPALPALNALKEYGMPLVIVSSKTRAEIEPLLDELPLTSRLFIAENGSAIYLDRKSAVPPGVQAELKSGYRTIVLGRRYEEVLDALDRTKKICKARVKGFRDMTDRGVARLTGLDIVSARLARKREYSEPFTFQGSEDKLHCLKAELQEMGMTCLEGGRLFHAMGRAGKGLATEMVINLFRSAPGGSQWKTVALGDGPNDMDMLRCADIAVVMRRPDGTWMEYDPEPLQLVIKPGGIGPAGWNESVAALLNELGNLR
ncbi:MAG TPA: HAD-IIB family hydrolase [Deltaproteobacteria bacterium]|nr:HAD-IIB family hydrolase [Deltaproteobacteria bacterium]